MTLSLSRRRFIGTALTALGSTTLPNAIRAASTAPVPPLPSVAGLTISQKRPPKPFVYEFNIGGIEAWSISDGHMLFKEGVGLMWPPEKRDAMARELVDHGERTDGIPLYVNLLVLRHGREVVLFDAGFGARNDPNIGWLAQGLASIGIAPEQVTQAILSHGHADHIGGFLTAGKVTYPNAALRVMRAEVDFWRSPQPDFSQSHRRDNIPNMIRDVRNALDVLQPNLQLHQDGDQILDGAVTFEAAPGHTDGHCILRVSNGGESLVHLMDLAHHHQLMFTDPSWFIEFDHRPDVAVSTRKKVFARLAGTRERAFGFHLPWPGIGRVLPRDLAYEWSHERWTWGS